MIARYLSPYLLEFLNDKIVFLSGPRQSGKTTLSKMLIPDSYSYYNYDVKRDLQVFQNQLWDFDSRLVIFDEIHKMKKWKLWLKGIYDDGHLKKQGILVTGSARLNISKKMGDSLAGRFFSYRLHPFDLKELCRVEKKRFNLNDTYNRIINISNFPEPYLKNSQRFYRKWQRSHQDLIIRQDLLMLEKIRDIDGVLLLIELLKNRVGSTITYRSLAEDLDRDDKTIKKWFMALENLYIGFRLNLYSNNIARGKKKAFKFYFYDTGNVEGDEGAKLENLVALALKKEIEFLEDVEGERGELYFIQTRDGKEIDFFVEIRNKKKYFFEVKLSDTTVSSSFHLLEKVIKNVIKIQLVKNIDRPYQTKEGVQVVKALEFLTKVQLL